MKSPNRGKVIIKTEMGGSKVFEEIFMYMGPWTKESLHEEENSKKILHALPTPIVLPPLG